MPLLLHGITNVFTSLFNQTGGLMVIAIEAAATHTESRDSEAVGVTIGPS